MQHCHSEHHQFAASGHKPLQVTKGCACARRGMDPFPTSVRLHQSHTGLLHALTSVRSRHAELLMMKGISLMQHFQHDLTQKMSVMAFSLIMDSMGGNSLPQAAHLDVVIR